jgi:large subunit ribosomal protein L23
MFQVPLTFSKFDLRDYLWNLYGLEATKVRSIVKISPPERSRRAPATKYMTIEMEKPFVWPAAPEDKEPWNNKLYQARERNQDAQWREMMNRNKGKLYSSKDDAKTNERKDLRKQAEALLRGEKVWQNDNKEDEKPL